MAVAVAACLAVLGVHCVCADTRRGLLHVETELSRTFVDVAQLFVGIFPVRVPGARKVYSFCPASVGVPCPPASRAWVPAHAPDAHRSGEHVSPAEEGWSGGCIRLHAAAILAPVGAPPRVTRERAQVLGLEAAFCPGPEHPGFIRIAHFGGFGAPSAAIPGSARHAEDDGVRGGSLLYLCALGRAATARLLQEERQLEKGLSLRPARVLGLGRVTEQRAGCQGCC
mmetsp:Transcript_19918/g.48908  ORF Transcript_19918/g.48908 Transcript_19918/m.48908 type:complete len:226 (+) Transcript_19918:999-1676(+)